MNESAENALLKRIYASNEWLFKGRVSLKKALKFKRKDYFKLCSELQEKEITAIIGPRQVGKTTLMYQLIQYLIFDKKINPKHIFYAQMDSLLIQPELKEIRIEELLETYAKNVLKKPLNELNEGMFVFLDEIQKVKDWNQQLKSLVDLKLNIKFVVSGSSSTNILFGLGEALTGRLSINIVMPMKFIDILSFRNKELREQITNASMKLRTALKETIETKNSEKFYSELEKTKREFIGIEDKIMIELDKYLILGGYPLTLTKESFSDIAGKLSDYVYLSVYKDIVSLFEIRNVDELNQLLVLIAEESPNTITYESIASALNLKKTTIKKYLDYLERAFLINISERFTRNIRKKQKSQKKLYLNDTGVRNSLLGLLTEKLSDDSRETGKLAEICLNNHLRRLKFNLEKTPNPEINYWKNNHEVDNVITLHNKPIPVESKYKKELTEKDKRGIKEFLKKHNAVFGIIITKNTLKKENNILFIPLWLFLLVC